MEKWDAGIILRRVIRNEKLTNYYNDELRENLDKALDIAIEALSNERNTDEILETIPSVTLMRALHERQEFISEKLPDGRIVFFIKERLIPKHRRNEV